MKILLISVHSKGTTKMLADIFFFCQDEIQFSEIHVVLEKQVTCVHLVNDIDLKLQIVRFLDFNLSDKVSETKSNMAPPEFQPSSPLAKSFGD